MYFPEDTPFRLRRQCNRLHFAARLHDGISDRFGKLGKTQGEPCCNSKAMGIHFPHNIRIRLVQLKIIFFAS